MDKHHGILDKAHFANNRPVTFFFFGDEIVCLDLLNEHATPPGVPWEYRENTRALSRNATKVPYQLECPEGTK